MSIKQYWKTEIKNIMKNTYAAFSRFFTITYKCGWVVVSHTSIYFAISKLTLLFSYSFHVPCIILSNVYFYIVLPMFNFLFSRSQSTASITNQMSHLFFFLKLKNIFLLFSIFWKWPNSERYFDVDQRWETRRCAFHFVEMFHLMEIWSVLCLYLHSGL